MGNITASQNITISVKTPHKQLFNFHKDYKQPTQTHTLSYPSFVKRNDNQHIEYCTRTNYHSRQYEINFEHIHDEPTLIFTPIDHPEQIWKNMAPNETITLNQGNIIKLADTQFQIKKICRSFNDLEQWQENQTISELDPRESINLNLINSRKLQHSHFLKYSRNIAQRSLVGKQSSSFGLDLDGQFCRYCYGKDSTQSNPLLNVCKCSGSVKFSHYYCLKNWITSRSNTRASDCFEYFEYDMSCQVCKSKMNKSVEHKGKKYIIYSDSLIHPPFVIMSYNCTQSNMVREFVINFDYSSTILIGKGSGNDIQLPDQMISNEHCSLTFQNNQLFLQNRNPTFGTFIYIQQDWRFSPADNQLELSIGNHLLTIKNQSNSCFWNQPLKLKIARNVSQ